MDNILQDLRFAARVFLRQPGFVVVTVLTLALGIGANSAMFSVVHAVLIERLPFPAADELVMVWLDNPSMGIKNDVTSYPNFEDTRAQSTLLQDLGAFVPAEMNLSSDDGIAERLQGVRVTANVFQIVGVGPVLGRAFLPEEDFDGPEPVVILSDELWKRHFASAPGVLGQTVRLSGIPHTVVGVMPPGFNFPNGSQLWRPLALREEFRERRAQLWLYQIGRRAPGASLQRVRAEMDTISARITGEHNLPGYGIHVESLRSDLVGASRSPLLLLLAAVAFVLLIACGNVVHLFLARAASREQEVVIRSALGAGRGRLIGQMLTESGLLAGLGGILGLVVARGGIELLLRLGPEEWTRGGVIELDVGVLLFTLALSLVAGLLVGVVPAFQASRLGLAENLKEGGRGASGGPGGNRVRQVLVVAEVALTLVLLVGAGLLLKSFDRLLRQEPGFRSAGLLLVDLALQRTGYEEPLTVFRFYDQFLERAAALPGVTRVGAGSSAISPRTTQSGYVSIEGHPDGPLTERTEVSIDAVTPTFFEALGVQLLEGRPLTRADHGGVDAVAVINEAMARRYWAGENPLGKRFKFGNSDSEAAWKTVVGVVADARRNSLARAARPASFVPHAQQPMRRMTVVLQGEGELSLLIPALRNLVRELDPNIPLARVAKVEELLRDQLSERRFTTWMLGVFSILALVLAVVGVYGVISHSVSGSRREIGVRMALGAAPVAVLQRVIRQGLRPVFLGLVVGLPLALLLGRLLSSLLFEVGTFDLATFLLIPLLLIGVSILAAYLPARRAARMSPTEVLRCD